MADIIKQDGEYSIFKERDFYAVVKGKEPLKTPGGHTAITRYLPVAEQLLIDWKQQGYYSYTSPTSLLSFQFTMQDNFAQLSKEELLDELNAMNWDTCWTFGGCPSPHPSIIMNWMLYFGNNGSERIKLIQEWMQNQTHMQLAASTCVYNAFMDYNVAFFMAVLVEKVPEEEHKSGIKGFYDFYKIFDDTFNFGEMWAIFNRFRLYYGMHFKEDGPHLPPGQATEEE